MATANNFLFLETFFICLQNEKEVCQKTTDYHVRNNTVRSGSNKTIIFYKPICSKI